MLDMTGMASLGRTSDRRREDAGRLLDILAAVAEEASMNRNDQCGFENMKSRHDDGGLLSEAQLAWLRDMADRYA